MCIGHSMVRYWAVTTGMGMLANAVVRDAKGLKSELGRGGTSSEVCRPASSACMPAFWIMIFVFSIVSRPIPLGAKLASA